MSDSSTSIVLEAFDGLVTSAPQFLENVYFAARNALTGLEFGALGSIISPEEYFVETQTVYVPPPALPPAPIRDGETGPVWASILDEYRELK